MKNPVWLSSCVTPAGTSNELDVQNEWEENPQHTHTYVLIWISMYYFMIKQSILPNEDRLFIEDEWGPQWRAEKAEII